ncbi:MAG: c-type cytochrome domain-containing protein, partial [Pirellulales bacterium]
MIHRFHVHIVLALCISLHLARSQAVGEGLPIKIPSSKEAISFQEDILPILAANCTACHNQKIREGGLSLDSAYELRKGGDSGVSVVAGKPSESMLFLRASHREEDFMPPPDNTVGAQTLTPIQLGMLEQWIVSGAKASDVTYNPISWKPLPRGSGGVLAVAMSQDEHLTATARGGRVSLFDTYTGHQLATLIDSSLQKLATDIAHADLITSLAFSPMKNMIATGSFRTIKFWQRSNLSPLHDFPNTEHAYLLGYLPTSNTIVFSLADGRCAKINPSEMAPKPTMHIFGESGSQIVCATISPDGSHLYGIRSGKTILTWRLVDGQLISQFERPHNVTSITITHDGSHLVTAESDNVLRVWKTPALDSKNGNNTLALLKEIPGASAPCIDLTTVPSHPGHLLGGCGDGKIRLWTIEQASMVREFAHGGAVTHLAVSPDGTRIASVGTEPGVKLWNLDDGTMIAHANGDFRIAQQLARHDASIRILKQDVVFAKSQVQQAETAKSTAADALKKASEKQKAAQSALKDKQDAHKKAKAAQKETAAALAKLTMFVESLTKSIEQATQTAEMLNNAVASTTVAAETVRKQVAEYPDAAEADKAYQSSLQATKMAQSTAVQSMTQIKKLLEESQAKHSELTKQLSDKEKTVTNAEEDSKKADRAVKNSNRDVEFAATEVQRAQETLPLRQGELKHIEQQLTVAEKTRTTMDSQYKTSAQPCMAVTFSADGTLLFACDASGLLTVYGGQDGKPRRTCT